MNLYCLKTVYINDYTLFKDPHVLLILVKFITLLSLSLYLVKLITVYHFCLNSPFWKVNEKRQLTEGRQVKTLYIVNLVSSKQSERIRKQ